MYFDLVRVTDGLLFGFRRLSLVGMGAAPEWERPVFLTEEISDRESLPSSERFVTARVAGASAGSKTIW